MNESMRITTDFLVIGSGIAGLFSALRAAAHGRVLMVTKRKIDECNTRYAQGGIASVIDPADSIEQHIEDTLKVGHGVCRKESVETVIGSGPEVISELIELGVNFTKRDQQSRTASSDESVESLAEYGFDLGQEGGHTQRRILHAGDITGEELFRVLKTRCRENPNIKILEHHAAVDLVSTRRHVNWQMENHCLGAYVIDTVLNQIKTIISRYTILATGGAGKVYLYTSNPDVASGDGVAMAYRAYAEIRNMEFFQFHPTCLYHPKAKSFLISEAVRGEGATLKIKRRGRYEQFMDSYHEQGSLAPRDIVARAIDHELKRTGQACVWLDVRHRGREFLEQRFPNIFAECLKYGYNMAEHLIPVVPAAHYCCGGVATDINGATSVKGLYAVGEVSCTGLHGANRLASNSLLEAVVMAGRSVKHMIENNREKLSAHEASQISDWKSGNAVDSDEQVVITHNWDEIRRFMWDYVGIVRTDKRLERAKNRIRLIRREIEKYYWDFIVTSDLVELRNIASLAEMIIDSALLRKESRGLHYNADHPEPITKKGRDSIIMRPTSALVQMEKTTTGKK